MRLSRLIVITLRHFENRLFEVATATMMTAIAIHLLLWPDAVGAGDLRYLLTLFSPVTIAATYGIGGCLRLAALVANGSWPFYGPKLRAAGAVTGAVVWAQMATSLILFHVDAGMPPTLDIWVYLTLTAIELIAMCRALVDRGRPD